MCSGRRAWGATWSGFEHDLLVLIVGQPILIPMLPICGARLRWGHSLLRPLIVRNLVLSRDDVGQLKSQAAGGDGPRHPAFDVTELWLPILLRNAVQDCLGRSPASAESFRLKTRYCLIDSIPMALAQVHCQTDGTGEEIEMLVVLLNLGQDSFVN